MRDPRLVKFAQNIVQYSLDVQEGEKVFIEMYGSERELVRYVIEEVYARGGQPYVDLIDHSVRAELLKNMTKEHVQAWAEKDLQHMKNMDCYVSIRAYENVNVMSDVPEDKMKLFDKFYYKPVHLEQRINHTRWVVMRYPNNAMAQLANMSTDAFENLFFNVCNLDYSRMAAAMVPLKQLMERTDKVRIVSPGTDLTFSIKGMNAIPCQGQCNLPDGECYTAPVRDSVNGTLAYNVPSIHAGITYENIKFRFENGKIVEATSNDTKRINDILDSDEGARYIGEFSLGFNPYILNPMKDILFDEKIAGSLHFTPGNAYDDADNGNRSAVHWDLVLIQRPEYGGGEVYFDDVLIRKDGMFVLSELAGLNPENLK